MNQGNTRISERSGAAAVPRSLVAQGLSCRRGGQLLFRNVNFLINAGELLFVRGPNGCGKTTLLRAVCGLTELAAGGIQLNGRDVHGLEDQYRSELAYVGHRDGVKDELTPLENLQACQGLQGRSVDEDAALDALEQAGLSGCEDTPLRYLSQGQRRRTALSRLLLCSACLWVLDEPLTALDVNAVDWVMKLINGHLARGGLVVATSHQSIHGLDDPLVLELG